MTQTTEADTPLCNLCKQPMVKRTNKTTKEEFWGCSAFPKCRGSRPLHPRPIRHSYFENYGPNEDDFGPGDEG